MSATFLTDLKNAIVAGTTIAPQTISSATTTNGLAVDMQLSDGPIHLVVTLGDCGDATSTLAITFQESATTTSGDFGDITGGPTLTTTASATANDNTVFALSTNLRTKRYIRAVLTTLTGSVSFIVAVAVVGRKKILGSGSGNQL